MRDGEFIFGAIKVKGLILLVGGVWTSAEPPLTRCRDENPSCDNFCAPGCFGGPTPSVLRWALLPAHRWCAKKGQNQVDRGRPNRLEQQGPVRRSQERGVTFGGFSRIRG